MIPEVCPCPCPLFASTVLLIVIPRSQNQTLSLLDVHVTPPETQNLNLVDRKEEEVSSTLIRKFSEI